LEGETVKADLLSLQQEWPIISLALFVLGVFAGSSFGPGFKYAIGLVWLAVAALWLVASVGRRRAERDLSI
jgi:hypothetical protein